MKAHLPTIPLTALAATFCASLIASGEQQLVDAPADKTPRMREWPSTPPVDCPFQRSEQIAGIAFTGLHAEYTNADTWYPSWASDGNLYSPWTDGVVNGLSSGSFGEGATTGHAKIVGDDPMNLKVVDQAVVKASSLPYGGRYPCGSLVHNGVWYYGTYCLMNENGSLQAMTKVGDQEVNWGVFGPFVGFRWSKDVGKTWTETPHTPARPLFPEPAKQGAPVKIGSPHFVDFGRNMEHSPDGKAYLVAHGAMSPDPKPRIANASWITGDQVFLLRVTPSIETVNDASKYEFFAGHDDSGQPLWTNDFTRIKPLVDWNNRCGCVTMTYNAPLKKYLMCITDGRTTVSPFDTYILESDRITGPWKLVAFMADFGPQAYFVNIPSKFIGKDGRTLWLCYAANFASGGWPAGWRPNPPGSRYGMCLQQVRLISTDEPKSSSPLHSQDNIAAQATVTVSSTHAGYSAGGAVDGVVGGFPGDTSHEWATSGESDTAMIRLTWAQEQTIDRIWLFDRPNTLDQIMSGMLIFSDGTTVPVGPLPDDAAKGVEIRFSPKKVRWLIFAVAGTKPGSPNIGLAEIAVFRAAAR